MTAIDFIRESNRIEGILREPLEAELEEYHRFMALEEITVEELCKFVTVYQPGAVLRDKRGLNVRIGSYLPPEGGKHIRGILHGILTEMQHGTGQLTSPFMTHLAYDSLHPFTDGNGRSGRMLWKWKMRTAPLGFLHTFYYQTLAEVNRKG